MTDELFDANGRLTTTVSYSGATTKVNYTYDDNKKHIKLAHQTGNLPVVNYLYQYNNNREVELSLYKEGDPLRKYEYRGNLLVKDSSANKFSTQKAYYSYYEYNSKGQLSKQQDFNGNDKLSREETYRYETNVVTVNGKAYPSYAGGTVNSYEKKNYYDAKGSLIKSTYTTNGKTETTEYKLDAKGNWIWKTGGQTRKITYYDAPSATNKPTAKTEEKSNTPLSLLLDENFDNNNNKWTVWDNASSAAQLYNGNYRINVKQSNNYASWLSVPALATNQAKDFAIETKIFLNSTETGNPNDSYWLLWGLGGDGKSFYAFGIYPTGKYQYGRQLNGVWDGKAGTIASTAVNTGINKANVLRVEKRKDQILFFINGVEVHKAAYEVFNTSHSGVGFQLNNKKLVDIDYLKIAQGAVSTLTISPEPYESDYQKKLTNANDSKARANAMIDYYVALKPLNYTTAQLETLLGQKFVQMMDIDYHGYMEMLMSKRLSPDDIKLCMKASEVLTKEQRSAIKLIAQHTVDEFVATQNNKPQPAYPIGVPKPGYGWGKTVSSNKAINNYTPPVATAPPVKDALADLKAMAQYLQGQMVYISSQKTSYFTPASINVNSLNDEITLVGIGAKYTYSTYYSRNVFGIRSLPNVTYNIKVSTLASMIDRVSGAYIVMEMGPCKSCSGQGSSWDNRSRTRSYCKSCNANGCVPAYIWNNGASRPF